MDTHRDARPGAVARPPRRAWHARARARTHTHTHTHSLTHSPYARPQEGALGKFSFSALMIAVAVGAPARSPAAALLWAGRRCWRRRCGRPRVGSHLHLIRPATDSRMLIFMIQKNPCLRKIRPAAGGRQAASRVPTWRSRIPPAGQGNTRTQMPARTRAARARAHAHTLNQAHARTRSMSAHTHAHAHRAGDGAGGAAGDRRARRDGPPQTQGAWVCGGTKGGMGAGD